MGFLEGLAYKYLGNVCIWQDAGEMKIWTYWTDGILRYQGKFFEKKIFEKKLKIRRDVSRIEQVSEDIFGDRLVEAKHQLAGNALSKEHLAAIAGIFISPLLVLPVVLGRSKAIEAKDDALRQEALRKLNDLHLTCMAVTLKDGAKLKVLCLPEIATKLLNDYESSLS